MVCGFYRPAYELTPITKIKKISVCRFFKIFLIVPLGIGHARPYHENIVFARHMRVAGALTAFVCAQTSLCSFSLTHSEPNGSNQTGYQKN